MLETGVKKTVRRATCKIAAASGILHSDGDVRSFEEDAEDVLAQGDRSPIQEWATEHLKWADVAGHAVEVKGPDPLSVSDFEDAWGNGIWDVSSTGGDAA
jgi:hypothetical protein